MTFERTHDTCPLARVIDLRIARVDIFGQRALLKHPLGGILEGWHHVLG